MIPNAIALSKACATNRIFNEIGTNKCIGVNDKERLTYLLKFRPARLG